MGLFAKRSTETNSSAPLYTIGGQKTMLIIGLGNPGKEYAETRHNAGYICLDAFANAHDEFDKWLTKKDLNLQMASGTLGSVRAILVKPTTFMNESGRAVKAIQNFYKVPNNLTLVVHDELDIPFGQIRSRSGGSDAGHNGIKSIISTIGADFGRVRIGILNEHKPNSETSDFVLKPFSKDEKAKLPAMTKEVENILMEAIYAGSLSTDTRSFLV